MLRMNEELQLTCGAASAGLCRCVGCKGEGLECDVCVSEFAMVW